MQLFGRLSQDIRFALRQLRKSPAFALTAVLTLALGIGANTAIFSLIHQALLSSLPVPNPQQLMMLQYSGAEEGWARTWMSDGPGAHTAFSYPMYRDLRDKNTSFQGLLAMVPADLTVSAGNHAERVDGELVSGNYFQTLGVRPALGRLLLPSDETAQNANPVAVLSFAYWQARFAMNPAVLHQTIHINSYPFTVVGVAAPGFHSVAEGATPDVFLPVTMEPEAMPGMSDLTARRTRWLILVGRLKPDITPQQAEASLQPMWMSLRRMELEQISDRSVHLSAGFLKTHLKLVPSAGGPSGIRDDLKTPLYTLAVLATLVLLLACLNLASLLLVRAAGRTKEMAVRSALGAGRWQIVRQMLLEGFVLGMAGGTLGALLAPSAIAWYLRAGMTASNTGEMPFSAHLDISMLLFNFGVAFLASLLFSLAPALQFARPDLSAVMNQQKSTASGGATRARRVLVATQFSFSLLLLVGAGLFAATLYNLKNLRTGFATSHILTFSIDPSMAGYKSNNIPAVYDRLLAALAAQPGVRSTAATTMTLLGHDSASANITVGGYTPKGNENMNSEIAEVSPGYFSTLEIPVLAGRGIADHDTATSQQIAVVNESFAKHYFGTPAKAIGQVFGFGGPPDVKLNFTIAGVVGDTHARSLREKIVPLIYLPYTQWNTFPDGPLGEMAVYVHTWQPPAAAADSVRRAVHSIDANLAIAQMHTMDEQIDQDTSTERVVATLSMFFAGLATLLSAIGLYGVLAYATAQRIREIAVRMALGAQRKQVLWLILQEVVLLAGIGIAVAVPISLLLARGVQEQLYGLSSYSPFAYLASIVFLGAIALLAGYIPARRAASVDPMQALRSE
ncbi:MAG TPA: ABC transporter permease [Acidobacteriaceae bacterium]|jgi:predicted permease|nr:ABC transporter permease [Acidobacteriaceae bacterium]